jgi:tryptophan 2,3-dioxygenase
MWFKDGPSPGEEKLTYDDYLKVPQLLSLQVPQSAPAEHDELQFIVVHQCYELWFKLVLHTLDAVGAALDRDDAREAARLSRRVVEIQKVLLAQLRVMETMLPGDFLRFRDRLQPASGFQSAQFREVEIALGQRTPAILRFFPPGTEARARLDRRLAAPALGDRFYALLSRAGHDVLGGREARLAALKKIYLERDRHRELVELAEALLDIDENLLTWRFHHVRMAERVIGAKQGTGGSDGVAYLEASIRERGKAFPELWEVRTLL